MFSRFIHLPVNFYSIQLRSFAMASKEYDEIFLFSVDLVRRVGEEVAAAFKSRDKLVKTKGDPTDLVTETDQRVEKLLIEGIGEKYPDHLFMGEETAAEVKSQPFTDAKTWIIDPIDGTMNFVHTFPCSCLSVALYDKKVGEIGIVYNPVEKKMYTARRGGGAFLNGHPIRVSPVKDLSEALIMFELGCSRDATKLRCVEDNFRALHPKVHGFRALGSAALDMCMVAQGGADAYYEYGLHAWDIAAGAIIVREAGGCVLDPTGGDFDLMNRRVLCAASEELAAQVHPVLTHLEFRKD